MAPKNKKQSLLAQSANPGTTKSSSSAPVVSRHDHASTIRRGWPDRASSATKYGRADALIALLLAAAVFLVFGQAARFSFVNFDDDIYVYENPHVLDGLTAAGIEWAFTKRTVYYWHPLTWLSLMADVQVLGNGEGAQARARLAAGMHLVNVALHAADAIVLFLVLQAMTASVLRSAFVAAVFAVHPLHVESVAWVTERKDVLSALFGLLAIGAYVWYARRPNLVRYFWVTAALSLGLMAKPILVTWPMVFLLLDYWPLKRPFHARLLLEKLPLLVLIAAASAITFLGHRSVDAIISVESVPVYQRILRAVVLYAAYLGKCLWPLNLAVVYPDQPIASYWPVLGAAGLLALITAGVLWGAWRGRRWLAVGWFWYLGTLLPNIGLVQVGSEVTADRYLYMPQIGICIILAWGAADLAGPWRYRRAALAAGTALTLAALMAGAWHLTSYWQDSDRLWTRAVAVSANSSVAHYSLGRLLAHRGQIDEAADQYKTALKTDPNNLMAYCNLGLELAHRGRIDEAIASYHKALEVAPNFAAAHSNLGNLLAGRGQVDEAIAHYRRALEIEPSDAAVRLNLGIALAHSGRFDEAIAQYGKVLQIEPDNAPAYSSLGLALADRGATDEAIAQYRKALELKPDYVEAYINLGNAYVRRREAVEAIADFRKALEIDPRCGTAHYDLANVLAERGQVEEATIHYRKALEINPNHIDALINLGNVSAARGQADEAIAHYRRALELDPNDAETNINLGIALAGHGQANEANAHYRKALALASARNDQRLVEFIRGRLIPRQTVAPGANAR